ncbi:hypothetical protein HMI54_014627 [Coelomomyces lativittatus]|nr:hypothetical protein HMI55_001809 [Coelomomyces lativittatus]KAJ1513889.1 hypothetical protein HMI54_014627 [Coelomomyces lativittatus]KAJ1514693.1 hypothetical protein HMI56_007648 [Coelomomyces lativittatus]
MPNSIPYLIAIQLVLLHQLKKDVNFDVSIVLEDPAAFNFENEVSILLPEHKLETLPSPWTFTSILLLPELGLQSQWSILASRNFIESKCEPNGNKLWSITNLGLSHITNLESLLENSLFSRDMNSLFLKLLKKADELDKAESEWLSIVPKLGDTPESDISAKLREHMVQLHRLNEFKDISQNIISHLANKSGKTMRQMYEELNLDIEDEEALK